MTDTPGDRARLEVARFLLSPEMSLLSPEARERALLAVLGTTPATLSRDDVVRWLAEHGTAETNEALQRALEVQCKDAARAHAARAAGLPLSEPLARAVAALGADVPMGHRAATRPDERVGEALSLLADAFFLERRPRRLEAASTTVADALQQAVARLLDLPRPDVLARPLVLVDRVLAGADIPEPLAGRLRDARATIVAVEEQKRAAALDRLTAGETSPAGEERLAVEAVRARFLVTEDVDERRRLLDSLLTWPTAHALPVVAALCEERWARERAMPLLSLRYGMKLGADWGRWSAWLRNQAPESGLERVVGAGVAPAELLLLTALARGSAIANLAEPLRDWCRARDGRVIAAHFVERWSDRLPADEVRELTGLPVLEASVPAVPIPEAAPERVAPADTVMRAEEPVAPPVASRPPVPAAPEPPPPPPPPSPAAEAWRGFLLENANLLAGIAMLLVGASLVAYFTWDRHWVFRYTIVPGLFGIFTAGLAAVAGWLERSDAKLAGTAAMLRGTAIALLPVNCMSVSLLADDPLVTAKLLTVPAMATVYLVLLTLGLRRWCAAVHPSLRESLAPGLVFLNALVLVRPLARSLGRVDELTTLDILTVGFYAGFFVVAAVAHRFVTRTLAHEQDAEPHVLWFTGGILLLTYLQVFVWVHAWERELPSVPLYGPLLVLAGGLVFYVERRFREVARASSGDTGEDSFAGFALVLAGLLAGFESPGLRIFCFALAGVLWLYQAAFRRDAIHDYLGLFLLVLSGASVALLDSFPKAAAPAVGLALSVALTGAAFVAHRLANDRLRDAARELQQALLTVTAILAALAQWHYRSEPIFTAAVLGAVAALLLIRAVRYESPRDALIGAVVLGLMLPYLGFADMRGRQLAGNTLVMGFACLSLLWLAGLRVVRAPSWLAMRSTVLFLYGACALAAMGARVFLERAFEPSLSWSVSFPEYMGPLVMLGVLVWTTYLSRSMLPLIGGLVIVVALFPAMKADFRAMFPHLAWGSGLGSAGFGLVTVLLAFSVRRLRAFAQLDEGDRFFGEVPFPLRRYDHTLFTAPLVAVAIFLAARVDTYTVLRNLAAGPPLKTAAAVLLTAAIWTLLGVWARERALAPWAVRAGLLCVFFGFVLGARQWEGAVRLEWPLLLTGLVLQAAELAYHFRVVPRHAWAEALLLQPVRRALHWGSVVVGAGLIAAIVVGAEPGRWRLLALLVAAQLVRRALADRGFAEGSLAVTLAFVALLAETAPGQDALLTRLSWEMSVWPALAFAAGVCLVTLALERHVSWFQRLAPLLEPARALAGGLALLLGAALLLTAVFEPHLAREQQIVLIAALVLVARWALPGPVLLLALLCAYVCALDRSLVEASDVAARLRLLAAPIPLALFSLLLAIADVTRRQWSPTARRAWDSPFAVRALQTPVAPWLQWPAVLFASVATVRHSLAPSLRLVATQAVAPYMSSAALVLLALSTRHRALAWMSAVSLTLGNIHVVRLVAGDALYDHGFATLHLVALGVAATLLQTAAARVIVPAGAARKALSQVMLAAGALVLILLSGNFAADPNLQDITPYRFVASGLMALAAGLSFRRAATRPDPDEVPYVGVAYAVYHFGLAMAMWCLVLLVPAFRQPVLALPGLALPALYFYAAGERFRRRGDPRGIPYGRSAAVVTLVVLTLYVVRPLFQAVLFPDATVRTDHYHYNAPLVILLGLLLLRLHAFEERFAIAYIGGTALMVGVYFGLTSAGGLSPFDGRYPAAWAGVVIAHAFTWLSRAEGPYRRRLQAVGRWDHVTGDQLAQAWHVTAFAGALELGLLAAVHSDALRFGRGALLGAVASILLQRSWVRGPVVAVTATLLAYGLVESPGRPSLVSEIGVLVVAVAAVRIAPGVFSLLVWLAVYLLIHHAALAPMADVSERWALLTSEWRLAALALGLSVTVESVRRWRVGRGMPPELDDVPGWQSWRSLTPWLGGPAATIAVAAALAHALSGGAVPSRQLWTSYLASAAHGILALSPGLGWLAWSAAALLALGNVDVLHTFAAATLRAHGVGEAHEIALGLAVLLMLLMAFRRVKWSEPAARRLADIGAAGALLVLAVLVTHYAVRPGLLGFGPWRAVLSGATALVAAEAIRRRTRRARERSPGDAAETLYHLATAIGIWSLALVVPALRTPPLALVTMSLPALYLWIRTEIWVSLGDRLAGRYRDSATALAAFVLFLYASRWWFATALFPGELPGARHYHTHALLILGLGLLLLRLHGLGAAYAIALLGGLSVLVGSYFGMTAWPGLSPFERPLAAAWAAIALVHFWTLATAPSSSVTAVLRGFSGLNGEPWERLRATIGKAALFATHLLAVLAIVHPATDSRAMAPLLCGTASLLVHYGWVRGSTLYFDLAALELLGALHADLFVPSLLPFGRAIWVLLAVRAVLVATRHRLPPASSADAWSTVCATLVVAHLLHHRPWSTVGLAATALLAVITAFVPRASGAAVTVFERLVVLALIATPTWLVHFGSAPWAGRGPAALLVTEPLLRTVIAALLTGVVARRAHRWPRWADTGAPRAIHQVRHFLEASGEAFFQRVLEASTVTAALLMIGHYGRAYRVVELVLFLALLAGLAVGWYRRGRSRGAWVDCFVAELCGAAALGLLRRQLLLQTDVWTYEYDLWASLAVSAILTGLKQRLEREPGAHEVKRPVALSIVLMPAFAIFWALSHHLPTDMVLLVVGLNSVLFAFLGRDRRDSPYNLVAVTGFVAFVLTVFWSKLDLRVLHAYVVPVGVGVLLLLQLFDRQVSARARDRIRLATVILMLSSTGYHALLDARYPVVFNVVLLMLCLACMALGALLRIRFYVGLGLVVLFLDLASLAAKALVHLDSRARMTWVGAVVFLLGALVIAVGVYHKARRDELEARLARWREKLGVWS